MVGLNTLRYTSKRHVEGELVYVFCMKADHRWMRLEEIPSRALRTGEIHELILSDNPGLKPGTGVRDVSYVGFFEVAVSGIAEIGDEVWAGGVRLGSLAGFDMTHTPNHLNIVVATQKAQTGAEMGFHVGTPVRFGTPAGAKAPPNGIHIRRTGGTPGNLRG